MSRVDANQKTKELLEELREKHVVEVIIDDENVKVATVGIPGTINYFMTFIIQDQNLFISGDLGSAVFNLTWNASLRGDWDISPSYFREKVAAWSEQDATWDENLLEEDYQEWLSEHDDILTDDDRSILADFWDSISDSGYTGSVAEELYKLQYHEYSYNSDLVSLLSDDVFEQMYEWEEFGETYSVRMCYWLAGLQYISETLNK